MTDKQHDARRHWWVALFEEAERLGVEQISDEELIVANRHYHRAETPARTAIALWDYRRPSPR